MLIDFFYTLRSAKLPVSVKEYLTLLEALQADVVGPNSEDAFSLDDFYYLSRTALMKIEKMGWDELMETLKKRFEEQKERHEGGNRWIGTGGTSPFGHGGYNPQGVR